MLIFPVHGVDTGLVEIAAYVAAAAAVNIMVISLLFKALYGYGSVVVLHYFQVVRPSEGILVRAVD
jgi:hypothetical protein